MILLKNLQFAVSQCYNEYGDIIKATMGKAREINKVSCALTMILSLITSYKEIQKINNAIYVSKSSQQFMDLKVNRVTYIKRTTIQGILICSTSFISLCCWKRNWQSDSPCLLAWMPLKIVKRLLHYIEPAFCLPCKIMSMQSMIRQRRRHVSSFWIF